MATFEEHIEGLTQIDITATSAPTINELTEILKEGLIHTVNTITTLKIIYFFHYLFFTFNYFLRRLRYFF